MVRDKLQEANEFIKNNKHKLNKEYRLNYHLMGEYGWINDPNGFIYYKGKYHLFYQHYPYEAVWGPMHWGHAVSEDLVKWSYEPIALAPDTNFDKDGCFSGTSIEKDGKLYLVYTGHVYTGVDKSKDYKQTQGIAYSENGIFFEKYHGNPVINSNQIPEAANKKDCRDPKVFKIDDIYYMVLGSNDEKGNGQVLLYKSKNLINWDFVNILAKSDGNIGTTWECPDLFKINGKDILMVSPQYMKPQGNNYHNIHSTVYITGNLDLKKGIFNINGYNPVDYGFDFYAPQTALDSKGRRIVVAWMEMWESKFPTQERGDNWCGAMTLPREVVLKDNKLFFKPVSEIENYRKNEVSLENISVNGENLLPITGDSYELQIIFDAKHSKEFGIKLRTSETEETVLTYSVEDKLFIFNRDKSGIGPKGERKTEVELIDNKLNLQIFVDKSSVEVFINEGEKVMTGRIYPSRESINLKVFSKGDCNILSLIKWDIK
ncbi:glycoside hydrolase family 32 protein [Clostridium sp. SYSU_GA19001]|uniref:glycoside hydrolase family 32 protein n=1 Tax=Clostridium caldaquaticum TaxID=2940653 RepID=UPI002076DF1D|nr:glycoside hydrolase family 32 protein [Clostridium caldaquaticum]MCM8711575.1 glycoside hydrolase family 32 protein [Clostridium caldaquaticum]